MVQGKINRGRHTDNPAGRLSIRTNQCPPPPSPHFYRPDALPASQLCQRPEGNKCIPVREKMPEFSSMVLPAPSPYRYKTDIRQCQLTDSRFYIPLDTIQVILGMLFPANLLISTEKRQCQRQSQNSCSAQPQTLRLAVYATRLTEVFKLRKQLSKERVRSTCTLPDFEARLKTHLHAPLCT